MTPAMSTAWCSGTACTGRSCQELVCWKILFPALLTAWQLAFFLLPAQWTQMTRSHTATAESMTPWLRVGNTYEATKQQKMMQPKVRSWRAMQLVLTEIRQFSIRSPGCCGEWKSSEDCCFLESDGKGKYLILWINWKKLLSLNWQLMLRSETHRRIADLCCSVMDLAGLSIRAGRVLRKIS